MKHMPIKKFQWDVYFNWTYTNKKRKEKRFELTILPKENTDHKHLKTKTDLSQKQRKVALEIRS